LPPPAQAEDVSEEIKVKVDSADNAPDHVFGLFEPFQPHRQAVDDRMELKIKQSSDHRIDRLGTSKPRYTANFQRCLVRVRDCEPA
jgi:REP element-mobilizing transposase RayT